MISYDPFRLRAHFYLPSPTFLRLPATPTFHLDAVLAGPPLADREYRLAQFHCHWGEDCYHGSEHQINGKSFAAEVSITRH